MFRLLWKLKYDAGNKDNSSINKFMRWNIKNGNKIVKIMLNEKGVN